MTTLAEIEAAVTTLKPEEMERLETFLRKLRTEQSPEPDIAEIVRRNGFNPHPRRRRGVVVTNERVQAIREEEGV